MSFKGDDDESAKVLPPVDKMSDEILKPLAEVSEDDSRPKSQTPESIGSFTVLEDGDDAEAKLKEFEEMTQPMVDDFDDSSSTERLPRRTKMSDQDSGIEPSPRLIKMFSGVPLVRLKKN